MDHRDGDSCAVEWSIVAAGRQIWRPAAGRAISLALPETARHRAPPASVEKASSRSARRNVDRLGLFGSL